MAKPRIIGGSAKGRPLETPKHGTRPSPARLREALFNILAFEARGSFLDLFSGSGAIGLEAASRGWQATCVDVSRAASYVIKRNATMLNLNVQVVQRDAMAFAEAHQAAFDVVFAAPPYPMDLNTIFQQILDAKPVKPNGQYIFQHPHNLALALESQNEPLTLKPRIYGSNAITMIRVPEEGGV